MVNDAALRDHFARALDWQDARVSLATALADLPAELRARRPAGFSHSAWELLEHLRIVQQDILEFCVNPRYAELTWPDDYWPPPSEPPTTAAWEAGADAVTAGVAALKALALDPSVDLFATIPHGSGQTYLRELLLVIDHNAYHVGQIVAVRRALGAWPG
ncbi:MAG: DinB family protein [Vicinamibacterales bacterium]